MTELAATSRGGGGPLRMLAPGAEAAVGRRFPSSRSTAWILDEDPDLAEMLPPDDRGVATELFRARVILLDGGTWEPPLLDLRTTYGLLLLDGLLARRARVGRAVVTELLSVGDILRPREEPLEWSAVPPTVDWRVLRPSRLAVLDARITRYIGQRPELTIAFSGRLLRRVRSAEYLRAIGSLARVEDRLLATLWHLASNWGTVTPGGVRIPFRMTHELLGEIVGATRPSITAAMRSLRQREQLDCVQGRYVLTGAPNDWNGAPQPGGGAHPAAAR